MEEKITEPKILSILDKINLIRVDLNKVLIDREDIIDLSIIALITQENIVLLGPPGTGKSMLANEICKRIEEAKIFQRLLTKYTDETELLISGQSLSEEDIEVDAPVKKSDINSVSTKKKITKIEKYTNGMLPDHDIAFLDEIFKANSAILNALLTLINEKVYFSSDGKIIKSNLLTVFGASNERPGPDSGLEALYDRFLIRYYVDYLKGSDIIALLKLNDNNQEKPPKITKEDILKLHDFLTHIIVPEDIFIRIKNIKEDLEGKSKSDTRYMNVRPSDRRIKHSLKLLKARALLQGRMSVSKKDIAKIYPYILWDTVPGTSSNLNKVTLEDLKGLFKNADYSSISKFHNCSKEIKESVKNLQKSEKEAKKAIENNSMDNKGKKDTCDKYLSEASNLCSRIDADIEAARNILSSTEYLDDSDKAWLESFIKDNKELKFKITSDVYNLNEVSRPIINRSKK